MKRLKRSYFILGIAALLLLSAAAWAQNKQAALPNVVVTAAKKQPITDSVEALGTLRANETVTLTTTVTETVTAVNFTDGQRVERGYVLIEMASGEQKAQLDQARAILAEAEQQLARRQLLSKQGATSQAVLDQAQRDYNAAAARLRETQSRLGNYVIAAPFSGVVGLRNISVGALLQPGTKITTLDDDSVMKLDFSIPSVFLQDVKIGMPVVADAREFEGRSFKGTVASIDSQIDPVTRSIVVRAEIPNPYHILKPGLLMHVTLLSNQRQSILLPEGSIISEGPDKYVLVVNSDNTAEKRKVTAGARRPGEIEILEGLTEGERVITRGTINVQPGQAVTVMAEETGEENLSDLLTKSGDDPE